MRMPCRIGNRGTWLGLAAGAALLTQGAPGRAETMLVTANVNCRTAPTVSAEVVRGLEANEQVGTAEAKGDWRKVTGEPPCWASGAYLAPAPTLQADAPASTVSAAWLFAALALAVSGVFAFNSARLRRANTKLKAGLAAGRQDISRLEAENAAIAARIAGVLDADLEEARVRAVIDDLARQAGTLGADYQEKRAIYDRLVAEMAVYDERLSFAEMGVYEPHFEFGDSEAYKRAIQEIRERQKAMVSAKVAVVCHSDWSVDGSKAKGQAMTNRNIRLTLRAFNNECEAAVANVRWNNVNAMAKRIRSAKEQIDKLNESNRTEIKEAFVALRLDELYLTHEYREKLKQEKEERAEAARLAREEQRLVRDLEEAEEKEAHFQQLLAKARVDAATTVGPRLDAYLAKIQVLEEELNAAHAKTERAKAMAEQTRSGYVYVISNIGSFGEGVVKIGLTRRLDPLDRIRELGDASVPFIFDTHAIIYSDDAPTLERALHSAFEPVRINAQNLRKEFFRASIEEVEGAVMRLAPQAPFFRDVEAQEYRETLARRQTALQAQQQSEARIEFPATL